MMSSDFHKYAQSEPLWSTTPLVLTKEDADALSKLAEALLRAVDTEQKETNNEH